MESEICEIIPSQKGGRKLNVRGYLMVKDKAVSKKYYWCCEFKKSLSFKGTATTSSANGEHKLIKFSEHNYSANANAASVAKFNFEVKKHAQNTQSKPRQII